MKVAILVQMYENVEILSSRSKILVPVMGKPIAYSIVKSLADSEFKKVCIPGIGEKEYEELSTLVGSFAEVLKEVEVSKNNDVVLVLWDNLIDFQSYSILKELPKNKIHVVEALEPTSNSYIPVAITVPNNLVEELRCCDDLRAFVYRLVAQKESTSVVNAIANPFKEPFDLLRFLMNVTDRVITSKYISGSSNLCDTVKIKGPVIIDDNVVIDDYVIIKGPVYIGKNCYIGDHSLIRPYTFLEEQSTIGSFCEVYATYIAPRVTVGRGSYITTSVIGESAIVKPGTVTHVELGMGIESYDIRRRPVIKKGVFIRPAQRY